MPRGGPDGTPDPDATVMIPAAAAGGAEGATPDDPEATVMQPARDMDPEATVMIPAASFDADATVAIPAAARMAEPKPRVTEPDPEATIAIPTPGRRQTSALIQPVGGPASLRPAAGGPDSAALGGLNPLIAAANPVLAIVPQIRHALTHPDPEGLRASVQEAVGRFETAARAAGHADETVVMASQLLCAILDEAAAATPWGGAWTKEPLLPARHGVQSPSALWKRVDELRAEPESNAELRDFACVCLLLGSQSRDRPDDGGRSQAELRDSFVEAARSQHQSGDGELSPRWRGVVVPDRRTGAAFGLAVAASCAALALAGAYFFYGISLGALSDPVARELAQLKLPAWQAAARPAGVSAEADGKALRERLSPEIARGEVAVGNASGVSTVEIRSDRLFASGSARLEPKLEPLILRIAAALEPVGGDIVVAGHTDDVPIRTARFPSNWELSTERAASVLGLMAAKMKQPGRLRAEGLADSAPLAPNDSAANRARNRRVTIVLRGAP